MTLALISRNLLESIEPAVHSLADRIFVLTGGRQGSQKHKPTIATFFETGLVVAIYEFLLMNPALAHLEILHERPYPSATRPEQVDLWIRAPTGGRAVLIEAGDFTPKKVKDDAKKMRRLNPRGTNWILAFFRDHHASQPWPRLRSCRRRKGSLKGCHVDMSEEMTESFSIKLPGQPIIHFGYSLIRVLP
jgi:hypothetical protein